MAPAAGRAVTLATMTTRRALPIAIAGACAIAAGARAAAPDACSAPQIHQFDFWIGDWDAAWTAEDGKPARGTNRVERILDGCVVAETFEAADGERTFRGRSHSVWDPRAQLWRQTWVDNNGSYLDFTGGMSGERMILRRDATLADGSRAQQRMVFRAIERDRFDWDWEVSRDGGATWQLRWQIRYTRRR